MSDELVIAGKTFQSRLILGTGRYRSMEDMVRAVEASGTGMITVAIRRLDLDDPSKKTILDYIDWNRFQILPNTAGCATVEEALFVARLGREVGKTDFVKLEVIPDPKYLFPDGAATLEAARLLVAEGFTVLPYIHADPTLAKALEEAGCATVMPLGSAIGSGQGIHTIEELKVIIEQSSVPVVVDAGLAVPSDAAKALEMGADAVLVNTAIAQAQDPGLMADAFKQGVEAGRKAYLAGRIAVRQYAAPSSPTADVPQPVTARS
ncbi:MAG: thiazole synthase [Dehalococcoidia bacterium]|jgi:thiazole synthase|nr:thiazole synthase [Dehalococcoidia bacterium]MDP7510882.1 thiazole synthase [Dehalococcoidia bacterium]